MAGRLYATKSGLGTKMALARHKPRKTAYNPGKVVTE